MKKLIAFTLAASPLLAFAQQITNDTTLFNKFSNLGNTVITIIISLCIIWIVISVFRYVVMGKDEAARKEGGMRILYGVVGLFVILSIWGLVAILTNSFDTNNNIPNQDFPKVDRIIQR